MAALAVILAREQISVIKEGGLLAVTPVAFIPRINWLELPAI